MIIKLGRHDGFKTLNVVRRREAIDELKALGGDAVIASTDGPIDEQVRRIVGTRGGEVRRSTPSAARRERASSGPWRPTGGCSSTARCRGEPHPDRSPADDRRQARRRGVLARPLDAGAEHSRRVDLFREIAALIRSGVLATELGPSFPLEAIGEAVREAEAVGRRGKVLLKIGSS